MDYKVIPNFLPKKVFDSFTNFFLKERIMNYIYADRIAHEQDDSGFFFSQDLYQAPSIKYTPKIFFFISNPLLYHAGIVNPIRVKVNCFIKQPQNLFTSPHIDYESPHRVFLYSVNTNNGFTILDPKNQNIKIPSVANQALFFDGSIEHQAVTQTDENVRINININYLEK